MGGGGVAVLESKGMMRWLDGPSNFGGQALYLSSYLLSPQFLPNSFLKKKKNHTPEGRDLGEKLEAKTKYFCVSGICNMTASHHATARLDPRDTSTGCPQNWPCSLIPYSLKDVLHPTVSSLFPKTYPLPTVIKKSPLVPSAPNLQGPSDW